MNWFRVMGAVLIALALLAAPTSAALAQGPVDDTPPATIELNSFVEQTMAEALETARQHAPEGPAPCLIVADHVPEAIVLDQQQK